MFMFARKPYLMSLGFEDFLIMFTTRREIRTLDSEIHFYKMETLLPMVIPAKFESIDLQEISG